MVSVINPYSGAHTIGNGPVVEGGASVDVSDEEAESLIAQGWAVGVVVSDPQVVVAPKGRKADAPEVPEVASNESTVSE